MNTITLIKKAWRKILFNYFPARRAKFTEYKRGGSDVLNCLIAYNKYGGYCVPTSAIHRPAVQKILRGQVYEPDTIEFIRLHCGDGDVVHGGTYFGDFVPALSQSLTKNAILWAFEPNKESYRCAEITVKINDLQNVELTNAGIGEKQATTKLKIADHDGTSLGGSSTFAESNKGTGEYITSDIASIDECIPQERKVSIIQFDVESYEKQALMGALKTIDRCKPILILEDCAGVIETPWFAQTILSRGYRFSRMLHNNSVFEPTA